MKKIFAIIIIILGSLTTKAVNNLSLSATICQNNTDFSVSLFMENNSDIVAAQMDIHCTKGFSISTDDIVKTPRLQGVNAIVSNIDNNTYRLLIYSFNNTVIDGSDGKLLSFIVKPNNSILQGEFLTIDNIVMSNLQGMNMSTLTNTSVRFKNYRFGDVNSNGVVDLVDSRLVMNYYAGKQVDGIDLAAADVNGDGKITMEDANALVNLYISSNPEPALKLSLDKTSIVLSLNGHDTKEQQLTVVIKPDDATNKDVKWTTSNSNVATVSHTGLITAVGEGECVITCTAKNVGGVKAECKVTVFHSTIANGHEWVDLGLSVKWATCNIGASKPEEYGDYFAWGETEGYNSSKKSFSWSTYKWCNGSIYKQTKYCTSSSYGTVDNKTVLDKSDDAASVNWGGSWRMPTKAEQDELLNTSNCTWTWTTMNGINGYKVVSNKNGNSIFLPAAGYRGNSSLFNAGSYGRYWSSSLYESYTSQANVLVFNSSYGGWDSSNRYYGLPVRAVCP